MAREITAGVLLTLKDQFSSKMQGAGVSVKGFSDKAVAGAEKVTKAFSGIAGTLGTLGVSIGTLGTFKSLVDLDDRMARLGLTANIGAKEVNKLKRQIFETAAMPDIKVNYGEILSGLEVVTEKIGDLEFARENLRNIGQAIQSTGESGEAIGDVFSEFGKFGYTAEQITKLLDDMIAQGDQGAFTFAEFAKNAPAVFSAYSAIGTSPEHIRKANAAMQILVAGTKSPEIAVTALNSTMDELSDPEKQKKLRSMGIAVRDSSGQFRDFNDIMFDIVAKSEKLGNADIFGTIFGSLSMRAVRSYLTKGERMYSGLVNLGDTAGLLQRKSAVMADTLKSSFQNLQTVFMSMTDETVSGPMEKLVDLMNYLSEDSGRIEAGIRGITTTLAAAAAVKLGAGIISFVANLKGIKSGGIDVSGLTKSTGGAGMPVYVTNWGGTPGAPLPTGGGAGGVFVPTGVTGLTPGANNAANFAKGARSAGLITVATVGVTQAIGAVRQAKAIDANIEMTDREKSKAKGGAIGGAVGTTAGTGAGVIAAAALAGKVGAMIGTAIAPGIGTAIGGAIGFAGGAAVGWLGGMLGKKAGEAIGDYAGFRAEQKALRSVVRNEVNTVEHIRQETPPVKVDGEIQRESRLFINEDGYHVRQRVAKNTTPYKFSTGSSQEARVTL
jgi:hypothetical protein